MAGKVKLKISDYYHDADPDDMKSWTSILYMVKKKAIKIELYLLWCGIMLFTDVVLSGW